MKIKYFVDLKVMYVDNVIITVQQDKAKSAKHTCTSSQSNQSQLFGYSRKYGPDAPGTFHSRANVLLPGFLFRVPLATQEQGEQQDPKASEVEG